MVVGVSKKCDSYKQVRVWPEVAELLSRLRKRNPMLPTTPRLFNLIVRDWLKERVK